MLLHLFPMNSWAIFCLVVFRLLIKSISDLCSSLANVSVFLLSLTVVVSVAFLDSINPLRIFIFNPFQPILYFWLHELCFQYMNALVDDVSSFKFQEKDKRLHIIKNQTNLNSLWEPYLYHIITFLGYNLKFFVSSQLCA